MLIKIESERYAEQNGKVFQTTTDVLTAFVGITILMGIKHLSTIRYYWSLEERLGNPLVRKAMTRAQV